MSFSRNSLSLSVFGDLRTMSGEPCSIISPLSKKTILQFNHRYDGLIEEFFEALTESERLKFKVLVDGDLVNFGESQKF